MPRAFTFGVSTSLMITVTQVVAPGFSSNTGASESSLPSLIAALLAPAAHRNPAQIGWEVLSLQPIQQTNPCWIGCLGLPDRKASSSSCVQILITATLNSYFPERLFFCACVCKTIRVLQTVGLQPQSEDNGEKVQVACEPCDQLGLIPRRRYSVRWSLQLSKAPANANTELSRDIKGSILQLTINLQPARCPQQRYITSETKQ